MYTNLKYTSSSNISHRATRMQCDKAILSERIIICFIAGSTIFFSLYQPDVCKAAFIAGYELCVSQLLFALFPFLIVANLLMLSGIAPLFARPFRPLFCTLGFKEPSAAAIFTLALLGGFAPAVSALSQSVKNKQLSPSQASRLLPCICFFGPSYIIIAIGNGMLHSLRCGVYLFIAQVLASICVTLSLHLLEKTRTKFFASPLHPANVHPNGKADAYALSTASAQEFEVAKVIGDAFFSFLRLCGILLYFQFLSTGFSSFFPLEYRWICEAVLEITAACKTITDIGIFASFRCCAALSLLSGSILLQISALCPNGVSCKLLLYTRLLHLPISLGIFRLLLRIPQTQSVYNSLSTRVIVMPRLPLDQAILLFIAFLFLMERLRKTLQRR